MLKTVLLVLGGLAAGLAVAFWVAPSATPTLVEADTSAEPAGRPLAPTDGLAAARLAALEQAFAAEVDQRVVLEERVAELAAQLEALGERPARATPSDFPAGGPDPAAIAERRARFRADAGARDEQAEQRFAEQLIAQGFAPDRADWIIRRTEELRMETLQAQYDAQRTGRPVAPGVGVQSLRAELGDADYEKYLQAYGRPTAIPVRDVLASSPAERSGLQAGDEIVAYAGKRVFDMPELNSMTLEGTPGESVIVEVRRDGRNVQLIIPRGPLGITGGGFRGR